jgi:hypothetical protein
MAENSVVNSVQPGRNGGTLRRGNEGNRGGRRPPEALRQDIRKAAPAAIRILKRFMRAKDVEPRLVLRPAEFIVSTSLPPLHGVDREWVTGRLRQTIEMLKETLPDPDATLAVARMRKIWT